MSVSVTVLTPATADSIYPLPHILNSLTYALLASPYFQSTTLSSVALALPTSSSPLILDPTLSEASASSTLTLTLTSSGSIVHSHLAASSGSEKRTMEEIAAAAEKVRKRVAPVLTEKARGFISEVLGAE